MPGVAFVEDDSDLREAMTEFLELSGFRACAFPTVAEALAALHDDSFDVLVTDLGLGHGAGGVELARAVRNDDRTKHIRLVAMSGAADALREHAADFDATLLKPVDLDTFLDTIRGLLDGAR